MDRVLLDTHALLWWRADSPELSQGAREAIADAREALVSVASLWEIAIKRALGKLRAPASLPGTIEAQGFAWLAIAPEHAWAVTDLPAHHDDPFDRLLIAQAIDQRVPIISRDPAFSAYDVETWW